MNIIIMGSGDTGTHLAKMLSYENQDVVLMSPSREDLESIDASYNLMTAQGEATSVADLERAGVSGADLYIAVTRGGCENIVSCQLASCLGAGRTVARVESEDFITDRMAARFAANGIDTLVYPEGLVAEEIDGFILRNWVVKWFQFMSGQLLLAAVRMAPEAPGCGRALKDLHPDGRKFHVAGIKRGGTLLIPGGNDILSPGDVVYFIMHPEQADDVAYLTGQREYRMRNIMIAGGGKICRGLCGRLKGRCNLTVVDPDRAVCRALAEEFPGLTVVNAATNDMGTLREEGIGRMDMFIALSDDAPSNIVACMMAKEFGVRRTVAQIEDLQYMSEAERLGIDKVVNKKLITSGSILRSILGRGARVESLLALGDAEVADIEVPEGARITRDPVRSLGLPAQITLGGMMRDGKGMLVEGDTRLCPGDRVMVFFRPGAMQQVERLFSR